MKRVLDNFVVGLGLAFGVMLTLSGVVQVVAKPSDPIGGIVLGVIGIPLLYVSMIRVFRAAHVS